MNPAALAALEQHRNTDGTFGEQHRGEAVVDVGTITTYPAPDDADYEEALLFKAVNGIREELHGYGIEDGIMDVRYRENGTTVVYDDHEGIEVETDGDISELIVDGRFDVGAMTRRFDHLDDDDSIAEMLEYAEHGHEREDVIYSPGGDDDTGEPEYEYGPVTADTDVTAVMSDESPVDASASLTDVATRKTHFPVTVGGVEYRAVVTDAAWVEATTNGAVFGAAEHNAAQMEDQGYPDEIDFDAPVDGIDYHVVQGRLIEVFGRNDILVGSDVSWDASVSGCDGPGSGVDAARELVMSEEHAADDFDYEVEMILDSAGQ